MVIGKIRPRNCISKIVMQIFDDVNSTINSIILAVTLKSVVFSQNIEQKEDF